VSTYYAQQPWENGTGGNTPVTAETLEHIERGIDGAHDRIDALAVGATLVPTSTRTSTVPPAAGQFVTYDASAGNLGPIPLPNPQAGVIMGMVKGDASSNTVTFTSGLLQGNGGSPSIVLRTTGENRTLYGSPGAWFVSGLRSPVVGTAAGTVAAGNDSRFSNTLTTALYGGATRTRAPVCEVRYAGNPFQVSAGSDVYAQGAWTARVDTERSTPVAGDGMLGTASGGKQVVNIPVSGRYEFHFALGGAVSADTVVNCRISRNIASYSSSVAIDNRRFNIGDVAILHAHDSCFLNQGDQLYWGIYTSHGVFTGYAGGDGGNLPPTGVVVRYIGPF
jgi:hypothetical protein